LSSPCAEAAAATEATAAVTAGARVVVCEAQQTFYRAALLKAARVGPKFVVDRDGFRWRGGLSAGEVRFSVSGGLGTKGTRLASRVPWNTSWCW
jgi:hypothetical protein